MKKLIAFILIFLFFVSPCSASNSIKTRALINTQFSKDETANEVELITFEEIKTKDSMTIPEGSTIKAEVVNFQRELRWHKSGYVLCKALTYEDKENVVDISDKEIYLALRKYEKIKGVDAAITSTEIIATSTVDVFLPGVSLAYFFTKGAIQREKHKNWFKAGVSNAYDNSICWFWLKGRKFDVEAGDSVDVKQIKKRKAQKLDRKITKRRNKELAKAEQKDLKQQEKLSKKTKDFQDKLTKEKHKTIEGAAAATIYDEE